MGRQRKDCPLCTKQGLVRLNNHLVDVHGVKERQQRQHYLDVAKKSECIGMLPTLRSIEVQVQQAIQQVLRGQL